ncbi:lipoyl(octanoyl) transferase LipB [Amycolatopsis kentuckyensis]|uniref:lipoyl(octanoyl) transferase LipB n=1 Tax=Amycolatopsis kentuckyensis TaxID=218823 RepID=UPI0035639C86
MGWPVKRVDLGEVGYHQALADMRTWVAQRQQNLAEDRLFLLSHPPIVTYGPRTKPEDLPTDLPAVEVDRGGFATYHGPGQLVGYLVVDALTKLGFPAVRRETPPGQSSLAGVWTPDHRKVASIGMRIRRGVTSHGFALNVDPDMTAFHHFTACGLADVTMVSLAELAAERQRGTPTDAEVRDAVYESLTAGN